MAKKWLKDVPTWEQEYSAMSVERTEREQEILNGDKLKSYEGMMYGRMYSDWKKRKGYTP